jgi:3-carboxy-cis,cis-muconate cycloisomerase
VVACGCGILTGALGKMARDVSLLMQYEVGEASEPGGGSSSMPHKRNPAGCARSLAAAVRAPALVAAYLTGLVQEHERAVGGWQAEWPTLAALIQTTGAAGAAMADVAEGLTVDRERMRRNMNAVGEPMLISVGAADTLRRELLDTV